MRASMALMTAALWLGCLLASCATGWPPPPTAPAGVFSERCRTPALTRPGGEKRGTGWASSMGAWGKGGRQMDMNRLISLSLALVMAVGAGGQALAEEPTPRPVPPAVDRPEALPKPPEVPTFAVCGAGPTCDCDTVVSVAQARDGQACTVTSGTGWCTFQSRGDEVGVCCVCRP
jgi:hypothetical protein